MWSVYPMVLGSYIRGQETGAPSPILLRPQTESGIWPEIARGANAESDVTRYTDQQLLVLLTMSARGTHSAGAC